MSVEALERERAPLAEHPAGEDGNGFGAVLTLWMGLTVLIVAALWLTGFTTSALTAAVEQGAARAESLGVGEMGDDLIRKAVRSQHDTLPFWTVLTFLGQFLGEPLMLGVRALGAATALSALAALMGRPVGYERALLECSMAQGVWVLGLAVRAGLMMALRRPDVQTSAVLFLDPGTYPAWLWLSVSQLDVFALIGWTVVARGGLKRGQVGLTGALGVCLGLWALEAVVRVGLGAVLGACVRLTVLPA